MIYKDKHTNMRMNYSLLLVTNWLLFANVILIASCIACDKYNIWNV